MTIQAGFALAFLAVALPLHNELANHAFGSVTLFLTLSYIRFKLPNGTLAHTAHESRICATV